MLIDTESSFLTFPIQIASMLLLTGVVGCGGTFLYNSYRHIDIECIKNPENAEMIRLNDRNTYNLIGLGVMVDPNMSIQICENVNPFMKKQLKNNSELFKQLQHKLVKYNERYPNLEESMRILDSFNHIQTEDQFKQLNNDQKIQLKNAQEVIQTYTEDIEQNQAVWIKEIFIEHKPSDTQRKEILDKYTTAIINNIAQRTQISRELKKVRSTLQSAKNQKALKEGALRFEQKKRY